VWFLPRKNHSFLAYFVHSFVVFQIISRHSFSTRMPSLLRLEKLYVIFQLLLLYVKKNFSFAFHDLLLSCKSARCWFMGLWNLEYAESKFDLKCVLCDKHVIRLYPFGFINFYMQLPVCNFWLIETVPFPQ